MRLCKSLFNNVQTLAILTLMLMISCKNKEDESAATVDKPIKVSVFETSRSGNKLTEVQLDAAKTATSKITIDTSKTFQTYTGFGGAFTESSAYLLNKLSKTNRDKIINAYFGSDGARYSLQRTHMNSCDFSLSQYSYAPVADDITLEHFTIAEDTADLIPFIKDAMKASEDGFKIFASPWTAPPWMKTNNDWVGGELDPKYNDTWALFFSKYVDAYKEEGIDIWGFTVENEPLGNGNNWESMHFTPKQMTDFVVKHLGPQLEKDGKGDLVILGYDQNRSHLKEWVDEMYRDETSRKYFDGTAVHWYDSTFRIYGDELEYAHNLAPDKYLIETEGCIDAQVPVWKDDDWYWRKEATDWGYTWAPEEDKHLHPKYSPVYRYARDIIGTMNNWVDGWVDWNMVLDRQGGPNWFKNWCIAPVIVDPDADEVYFTPLYYVMSHFSKYVRPGAKRVAHQNSDNELQVTVAQNQDGSVALIVFNPTEKEKVFEIEYLDSKNTVVINPQALQTIMIN
jgi:glucosylceramidase